MTIGFWRSWALVVGMMVGSGIFTLPAILAPYGSYSFAAWLVTAFGALCLVFSLSHLATRNPKAGGPYAYVLEAFGKYPAMIVAWGYWISVVIAVAAIAISFSGYLGVFFPIIAGNQFISTLVSLSVVWAFTYISLRGVEEASIVQLITTVLKIIPLLFIGLAGLMVGDVTSVPALNPHNESLPIMISGILLLIMWSYIGIESATIPADETINPKQTIPRALIFGTLTATVVYVISLAGVMALLSLDDLSASTAPFADAAFSLFGTTGAIVIGIGALISIGGALNACVFLTGVVPNVGAKDHLFPKFLAHQSKNGTGARAIILSSSIASIAILINSNKGLLQTFELMILISTFSVLIAYLGAALASIKLQFKDQKHGIKINFFTLIIAILASLFSASAIFGAWTLYQ